MQIEIVKRQIAKSCMMHNKWCLMTENQNEDNFGDYLKFKRMMPEVNWHPTTQEVELILHKYAEKPYIAVITKEESVNVVGKHVIIENDILNERHMTLTDISAIYSIAQYMLLDNFIKNIDKRVSLDLVYTDEELKNASDYFYESVDRIITYNPETLHIHSKLGVMKASIIW